MKYIIKYCLKIKKAREISSQKAGEQPQSRICDQAKHASCSVNNYKIQNINFNTLNKRFQVMVKA